ncbi:MAG TPA: hypothetical protein VKA19_13230 [Alphaproteobacteria bacterium]|nr:hypothetical protein [Alphaproteobacteria bacterium]
MARTNPKRAVKATKARRSRTKPETQPVRPTYIKPADKLENFGLLPNTTVHDPDDPQAWLDQMLAEPPSETVTVLIGPEMAKAIAEVCLSSI